MLVATIRKYKMKRLLRKILGKTKVYVTLRYFLSIYLMYMENKKILKLIFGNSNPTILNGPFKGLSYLRVSTGSMLLAKIIGSYEEPIMHIIEKIVSEKKYKKIIDIGCAEGYYAVGLAKLLPDCQITAIDTDSFALFLCKKLSKLNQTENLILVNQFTESIIQDSNLVDTLIICDIEGDELVVLNPNNAKFLLNCDLLIECHDFLVEGTTQSLTEFYEKTHTIEFIPDYHVRFNHYDIPKFNYAKKIDLFDERRPEGMNWLYLKKNP
jgi:hypothetical protein